MASNINKVLDIVHPLSANLYIKPISYFFSLQDILQYNCLDCDKTFSELAEAQKHYDTGHNEHNSNFHDRTKSFTCIKCDFQCNKRSNLKQHVSQVHDEKNPYKCAQCGYRFKSSSSLMQHISRIHDKNETFVCTQCDTQFKKSYDLRRHSSIHENEKFFT